MELELRRIKDKQYTTPDSIKLNKLFNIINNFLCFDQIDLLMDFLSLPKLNKLIMKRGSYILKFITGFYI